MDIVKVDLLLVRKISKRHFLRDIEKSFQEVTPIGPEPHQFFSFWNISTNTIARGIQSFGRNGPWLAGWLSNGQNFSVKFAQTCDKQMLKISRRYLDLYLSYGNITDVGRAILNIFFFGVLGPRMHVWLYKNAITVDPWFSDHRFSDNPWFSDTFAADQIFM